MPSDTSAFKTVRFLRLCSYMTLNIINGVWRNAFTVSAWSDPHHCPSSATPSPFIIRKWPDYSGHVFLKFSLMIYVSPGTNTIKTWILFAFLNLAQSLPPSESLSSLNCGWLLMGHLPHCAVIDLHWCPPSLGSAALLSTSSALHGTLPVADELNVCSVK